MNGRQFSSVLRGAGAALLLISASTFLLTTWSDVGDLFRYGILGGHVLGLLALALYIGGRLKETKTARVILWTSTAILPCLLTALGGLLYSQFGLDPAEANLPQVATWIAPDPGSALLALAATIPLLVLVSRATARVLSPGLARTWTQAYVTALVLFLVPLRTPEIAGLLAAASTIVPLFLETKTFRRTTASSNLEGRLLRALLWAPPMMIALRTITFYDPGATFYGVLLLSFSWSVALLIRGRPFLGHFDALLELVSAGFGASGAYLLSLHLLPASLSELAFLLPTLAVILQARLLHKCGSAVRLAALLVACGASALTLLDSPSVVSSLVLESVFAVALIRAVIERKVAEAAVSALLLVLGAGVLFQGLIGFEDIALWQLLSGLGVALFVLATALEKNPAGIARWFGRPSGKNSGRVPLQI